nr:MAG TPA: hypothetical protein [Caudoviricetes sp.]
MSSRDCDATRRLTRMLVSTIVVTSASATRYCARTAGIA